MASLKDNPLNKAERLIYALFFLSGLPALLYQITWQRALFRIFGVNAESTTIVVTAFMLGLGIGNLAGGLISQYKKFHLLLVIAFIEISVGLFGIVSLHIFEKVGALVLSMPLPVTAGVVLCLILIPTMLMGATLPILVAHFAPRVGSMGASVGSLYYVNTLGAGVACLLCVALLFPFGGMTIAVNTGAAINICIGALALFGYFFLAREGKLAIGLPLSTQLKPRRLEKPLMRFDAVLLLSGVGGFIALSFEIFYFRVLNFASASSACVFAVTLGAFLVGLASGAGESERKCRVLSHKDLADKLLLSLGKALILGFLFLPILSATGAVANALHTKANLIFIIALPLIFLTVRAWGFVLPSLTELAIQPNENSGLRISWVYVSNILGSALGATLTGFVLTDWLSLQNMATALFLCGLGFAALFFLFSGKKFTYKKSVFAVIAVVVVAAAPVVQYVATPHLLENVQSHRDASSPFIESVENRDGIITVDAEQTIYGNGAYDGRFNTDLVHDTNGIFRPFALSLFHPHPHNVLMIGLSSGSWAQVIANNPEVEHLIVVEVNPGYLQLIKAHPNVASILNNPKVRIIIDDGRRWLRLHPENRYDAIVANSTYNFRSNATNLLSQDFLAIEAAHLNKGGIVYYNTTDSARVQHTGCLVFPYGLRFFNHIVLSNDPINLDFGHWLMVLREYKINGAAVVNETQDDDRQYVAGLMNLEHDYTAMDSIYSFDKDYKLIEECPDIRTRTQNLVPITDDNMGTEWRYAVFGDN